MAERVTQSSYPKHSQIHPVWFFLAAVIVISLTVVFAGLLWVYLTGFPHTSPHAYALAGNMIPVNTTAPIETTPTPSLSPSATATPFQPVENTATPTITPSPTATATNTATPTPSATPTSTATATLPPSPTPEQPDIPDQASISGVTGYAQALTLSCESRSAVDWARYFGVSIQELDFQYALPSSDNPNTGFVGDPNDARGYTPPRSYGVHAPPVAQLLQTYGLNAAAATGWTWDQLRSEIAADQPVIVWVIGNVWNGYQGKSYTASDGETLTVAPYEHTVIVVGYTPGTVTVVDNQLRYSVSVDQFLQSWQVLGNMAVYLN